MVLSRATTVFALLEEYPFLERFLVARHEVFARLTRPGPRRTWARMVTLGEAATAMDEPVLELLRELRSEVLRVRGVAPAIAADDAGSAIDLRLGEEVRALVRRLEQGASLTELADRLDGLTRGLDAEAVAAAVHEREEIGVRGSIEAAGGSPTDDSGVRLTLYLGHPVRALQQESARLGGLATHVEEAVAGLGEPPDVGRWRTARPVVVALLERLAELELQARRLRLAWFTTLASRGQRSVTVVVGGRLDEAVDAIRRLLVVARKDDPTALSATAPRAVHLVRHALLTQEELLVPAALRALDDDDWEAVAEQERVVGWALAPRGEP